jgi:hypothetical protein
VRVLRINLRLVVALGVLAMASPAHATPISAHAMVHTCCMADETKERIFAEADAVGAEYIRVDIEMSSIFEDPAGAKRGEPDWSHLDDLLELAEEHKVKVLGPVPGARPTQGAAQRLTPRSMSGWRVRSRSTPRTPSGPGRS